MPTNHNGPVDLDQHAADRVEQGVNELAASVGRNLQSRRPQRSSAPQHDIQDPLPDSYQAQVAAGLARFEQLRYDLTTTRDTLREREDQISRLVSENEALRRDGEYWRKLAEAWRERRDQACDRAATLTALLNQVRSQFESALQYAGLAEPSTDGVQPE